jgi:RNA polymerase sigma factor (sigma-70 family)
VRPMDDAELVEAARSGDASAWASIYDRYADRLHDHCHRILHDRDEAADALHDAFLAATRNLHQLRDPSRLRPWLYSICRHEAVRRARRRDRVDLTAELDDVTGIEVDMDRGTRAAELQELVWAAAAGLNPRDQALLDLSLRQGLEGQDLADAMGTSLDSSYVMLSRMRDQVERSLGALLIARLGRDDCDELDRLLVGWDGRFSPVLRKRVARHVDGCDVCRDRRAAVASPLALLAAAPLVPAPASLRSLVLDDLGRGGTTAGAEAIRFTREGFAADPAAPRTTGRAWLVAAVALLVAGLVAGVMAAQDDDPGTQLAAAGDTTTSTTGLPATTTTTTTATAAGPSTSVAVEATTTSALPVAPPPSAPPAAPPSTDAPTVVPPPPPPPPDTSPPVIDGVTGPSFLLCGQSAEIVAVVREATSVVLTWSGALPAGQRTMSRSGDTWTATLGPFSGATPPVTFAVVARDAAGNEARETRPINVTAC